MRLDRRQFLALSGLTLAACGSSNAAKSSGSSELDQSFVVAARYPSTVLVPGTVRLPVSFAKGTSPELQGPESVRGRLIDDKGKVVADGLTATRHAEGLPVPYWPFVAEIPTAGLYTLQVEGASADGSAVQVLTPGEVLVPQVGQSLPPFETPTVADGHGVDPICTRKPACSLHQMTLTEALALGKPVAYLIGTPAYCQVGICGPVLDLLLAAHDRLGDKVVMVHSEVYTDDTIKVVAPAVLAYQLDYEPSLFLADATGKIVDRLDAVWDKSEQDAALAKLTGR